MKVYVLLFWFYEGDSNLVDSFCGVFSSYDKALKGADPKYKVLTSEEREKKEKEWGSYGYPSFYEVRQFVLTS